MTRNWHCQRCGEPLTLNELENHFRLIHPDLNDETPETWPDGHYIITDLTHPSFHETRH